MSRLDDQNAFSSECVPLQRQIRTLLVSHTLNNCGDLVFSLPVTSHQEPVGLLLPVLCVKSLCPNISRTCSTVDLRNEFNFWNVHGTMNTSGLVQSK